MELKLSNREEIFNIVKKYIIVSDPYGLIYGGASEDEFDDECLWITREIIVKQARDIDNINCIINDVFSRSFDAKFAEDEFLDAAKGIVKELSI